MPDNKNIDIHIDEKINKKLDKMLTNLKNVDEEKYDRIIKKYFGDINKKYNGDSICHLLIKKYILDKDLENSAILGNQIIGILMYLDKCDNLNESITETKDNEGQNFLSLALKYNCDNHFIYNIIVDVLKSYVYYIEFNKEFEEIKGLIDYFIEHCNTENAKNFLINVIHYHERIKIINMTEEDLEYIYIKMEKEQKERIENKKEKSLFLSALMLIIKYKNIESFVKELEEMKDIISFVNLFHKDKQYEILYTLQKYAGEKVALEEIKEIIKNNELLLSTNIIISAVGNKKSVNYISELLDFFASMGFVYSCDMIRSQIMEVFVDKRRSFDELADMYTRVYKYGFHEKDLYNLTKRYYFDFENYYQTSFGEGYSLILRKSFSIILERSLTKLNIKFKRDEIYNENFVKAIYEIKTLCSDLVQKYNDFILCDMLVNKISDNLNSNIMYNHNEISASDILKVLKNIIMEEMENEVDKILIKSKKENAGDTNA